MKLQQRIPPRQPLWCTAVGGLEAVPPCLLREVRLGIEREALRVTPDGALALTPHPTAFGDKAENSAVTVDFSESQLELVTAPEPSPEAAHAALAALHGHVRSVLTAQGEQLWPHSMPPELPDEYAIPIARFDDSEDGRRRELYRIGLAHRYGRRMQMISGVHVNLSFAEEVLDRAAGEAGGATRRERHDAVYFRAIRNFLRRRWLLLLLTGASPSRHPDAPRAGSDARFATSLRMSHRGYANEPEDELSVSYDNAQEYVRDMRRLLQTPSRRFAGLKSGEDGHPRQLNDRILQLEKEHYAPIRPKGAILRGETHMDAIARRGVAYLEIRLFDLNPFAPEGIDLHALRFIHLFLLDCLFGEDDRLDSAGRRIADINHERVASEGRRPGLNLDAATGEAPLAALAHAELRRLEELAEHLDTDRPDRPYGQAVHVAREQLTHPERLLSARILAASRCDQRSLLPAGPAPHAESTVV